MRTAILSLWALCWSGIAVAQVPDTEAAQQYSAAVALQNQQLYDLAAEEWQTFLTAHADHKLAPKASYYLGVCRFQQHDYVKAERAFAAATKQRSSKLRGSAFLNLGLAQFNQAEGRGAASAASLQKAIKTFETMAKELPDATEFEEALFYLAEAQYAVGDRAGALATYQRALRKFPQHARRIELLYGLGTTAAEEGKQRTAKDAFSKLVASSPKEVDSQGELIAEARIRLADLLLAEGSNSKARRVLVTASQDEDSPLADYAMLRLAESFFVNEEYSNAAEKFARLVQRFPESEYLAKAMIGVAKSRFLAGDAGEAIRWLDSTGSRAQKGATAPEAAHWLARAYLKQGQPAEAVAVCKSALSRLRSKQERWKPTLQMDLADALFDMGQTAKAAAQFEQIADRYPDDEVAVEAAYMATLVAMQDEDHREALRQAEHFAERFTGRDRALTIEVRAMRAEALLQLGKYDEAARQWKKLIRDEPDRAKQTDWPLRLAVCYQEAGDHGSVIRTLRSLRSSDQKVQSEAALLLAAAQGEKGDSRGAQQTLQRLLSSGADRDQRARAQLLLVGLQRRNGNTEQALQTLKRLKQESPELVPVDVMLEQADLLFQRGDFPAAAKSYQDAVEAAGKGELLADAMLGWGWALLESQQLADAERVFRDVTAREQFADRHAEAIYGRAVALFRSQQFEQASQLLKRFLGSRRGGTEQDRADATYLLGMCQVEMKEHEAAIRTLTGLVKKFPNYASNDQALYELAWAFDAQGATEQAATTFEGIASLFPDSKLAPEAAFRYAESRYDQDDYRAAEKYYRLAAEHGDATLAANATHKLGWVAFQRGDHARARKQFLSQIKKMDSGPRARDARLMIAECLFQEGDYAAALDRFDRQLSKGGAEVSPQLSELALLHAGQAAGQLEKWDQALKWMQRCTQAFPESAYTLEASYEQARALQALGRRSEALPIFERVAEADPGLLGARARFMQGELLFAQKDFDSAIRSFFKVAYGYGHPRAPKEFHVWQADAMFEAARCCESTRRTDAAEKLYRDLVKSFPDSEKAEIARKKLQG